MKASDANRHECPTSDDLPLCDLVLKGGITSGVVYPQTIAQLAKGYRFKSIGGTSAGAIAAAAAAAAEFARDTGGFQRLQTIPNDISDGLLSKFQPVNELRPLFEAFTAMLGKTSKITRVLRFLTAYVAGHLKWFSLCFLPFLLAYTFPVSEGWLPFWSLFSIVLFTITLVLLLCRDFFYFLPKHNFGICPGSTTTPEKGQALTNWLADKIDYIAGLYTESTDNEGFSKIVFNAPLTFKDLESRKNNRSIILKMITTDLNSRRPFMLPFENEIHFFKKSEFLKLFPERVVKHMCSRLAPKGNDYYYFPSKKELPVVVAARMSLSFPLLIQAIPVYKIDYTIKQKPRNFVKCMFSDGGISNNLPMHIFDAWLPGHPTFAVNLEPYDEKRHGEDEESRVYMDKEASSGHLLPIYPINSTFGFLLSIMDAAKDWQHSMQRILTGYRGRIVHIALNNAKEGGINLNMDSATIRQLEQYGKTAGKKLRDEFDFDDHRWRRIRVTMPNIEKNLIDFSTKFDAASMQANDYENYLKCYTPTSYRPPSATWFKMLKGRMNNLAETGKKWQAHPAIQDAKTPRPGSDLRITPRI